MRIEAEARLLRALAGDLDLALFADVGDGGILQRLLHRLANLRAGAAQEALAVGEALAFGIETPVDEMWSFINLSSFGQTGAQGTASTR